MRYQGKLSSWNEDRGFGFIEWNGGSDKVFVHISAFTTKHRRPVAGDIVTYEVTKDANGRHKAVDVGLVGVSVQKTRSSKTGLRFPWRQLLTITVIGAVGTSAYLNRTPREDFAAEPLALESRPARTSSYQCSGKTHCSEMQSCEEAEFYIRNCPGTQMDGDGDGVPCESQWCGN